MQLLPTHILSYSYRSEFSTCPRKFQLRAANTISTERSDNVDTAFGTAAGAAVAWILENIHVDTRARAAHAKIIAFANWNIGLFDEIVSSRKSMYALFIFIEQFNVSFAPRLAQDYKIANIFGKSSVEFGIAVLIPADDGNPFLYKGNIDFILQHKTTGALTVVDMKTTGRGREDAEYIYAKRSQVSVYAALIAAALGLAFINYSYLVYNTKEEEIYAFDYTLTPADMDDEIIAIHATAQVIALYESLPSFPRNGNACVQYGRPCQYWNSCNGARPVIDKVDFDTRKFTVFDFEKLLALQLEVSLQEAGDAPNENTQGIEKILASSDNSHYENIDNLNATYDMNPDSLPKQNTDWL